MGPTGDDYRVLQVHPTLRCNLRCLHCYSSSGPAEARTLPLELLCDLLTDASAEDYNVAGFSGGEPLLYPGLRRALEQARGCGMRTTVTSNGMLLDDRRLDVLSGVVDLLAISLDGPPASHNRLRASSRAFGAMAARLDGVRRSGIPFGFIFTLTQHNVHELGWVAEFAMAEGAQLLQIHPLEGAGRAETTLAGAQPDAVEQAWAFLEATRIQTEAGDRLRVQLDLTDRALLCADPARGFVGPSSSAARESRFGWQLSPLVVEPDGTVVPVQFGFPRRYALGNLAQAPLPQLIAAWRAEKELGFQRLCREVFSDVAQPSELPFVNWYELLAARAALAPMDEQRPSSRPSLQPGERGSEGSSGATDDAPMSSVV